MTVDTQPPAVHGQQATIDAIHAHHAQLGRTMADHAITVRRSVDRLMSPADPQARMVAFSRDEVVPHALAEEGTLYRAAVAVPEADLLVRAMLEEHRVLQRLVDELAAARTPGEAAGAASALNTLFQSHLDKENELLLPALLRADVDLGSLLDGMHEILGGHGEHADSAQAAQPAHDGCTCGGNHDEMGDPDATAEVVDGELDVRELVPAQRHEQIFATFRALTPGSAFVLINDHDPKPLSYQFAAEHPGEYTWAYLEAGPQVWRVRIGRP